MSEVVTLLKGKAEGLRKQASFIRTYQETVIEKVASELNVDRDEAEKLIKEASTKGAVRESTPVVEDKSLVVKAASESLATELGIDFDEAKIIVESVLKEAQE